MEVEAPYWKNRSPWYVNKIGIIYLPPSLLPCLPASDTHAAIMMNKSLGMYSDIL